ncbi:RNA polymerase sigma54 factor [Campylobacter pinnipediorum subsp. caledonicus]|uniref:RNA polymerase sigma54 factor n=1 Tax=Campylobacter pinnipediorum subsp. caledonicus TaxID=1874362 RepID=A0A1S6U7S3_9BACT|nr:RNA polymerase factor sigma-54 [Campylobacter pinnipediorum]AQW86122.1 RNA polymerase sigma54 factor [Campylobacter pinnipediorum subsp. caledonicus]AQW87729.1 RNA polymerase sigma54 factor [Campylobacter pinnipediorum subsp. caledonicus]OPA72142.1 RNA polymerase factor sigma-54 [Campylobacter pinnipediorum subsp. caledonicus]
MLRQKTSITTKNKLNQTLRSWLGILQSGLDELKETLEPFAEKNPFITIEQNPKSPKKDFFKQIYSNSATDNIEALTINKDSLYDILSSQINPPLFPTKKSQNIAYKIIQCINSEGYFEYDKDIFNTESMDEIEKIRDRFTYLEPAGVGAKDLKESFMFQLEAINIDDEIYKIAKNIILNFDSLQSLTKTKDYEKAIAVIKKFKNPPAIEYIQDDVAIFADIFIDTSDNNINVSLNSDQYPNIVLDVDGLNEKDDFVASKIKEAKELIDALELRKSTLYKIGLMIVEYQYDFFFGGDIKPMKLKDIADDLDRNPSTISRAISNKYLQCSRGLIPLKNFFATALDDDVSNATIKSYVLNLVKNENQSKPLSDLKILELIQDEFKVKMVRRTITKYRKALNIASSSERKRIYAINNGS